MVNSAAQQTVIIEPTKQEMVKGVLFGSAGQGRLKSMRSRASKVMIYQFIWRKIFLWVLEMIQRDIEREINQEKFDHTLSGNLDSVLNLQERYSARSSDPCGDALTIPGAPLSGRESDIEHLPRQL